ncbi:hypothetical protein M9Y10_004315 [Tritrichomonas musculus]|uniref:Uncharacterized protein n=1 Tax=Tritrichomonas musculus TaxID=1915356 RepID=A0ABR2JT15_9EUKA
MSGFTYTIPTENLGFDYIQQPLTPEKFSATLLQMRTPNNKVYLSDYMSKQLYYLMNPHLIIPPRVHKSSKFELLDDGNIDPNSPIFRCNYLIMNPDGTFHTRSQSITDGVVRLDKHFRIDITCPPFQEAIAKWEWDHRDMRPYLMINNNNTINIESMAVKDKVVILTKNGQIDKRCKAVKENKVTFSPPFSNNVDRRCEYCKKKVNYTKWVKKW